MEKSGFIYIWRDRKNKRYYVGCHWGTETDGYICSSPWMSAAYKRRPDDFKRRIIVRGLGRAEMYVEELRWLKMMKSEEVKIRYFNLNLSPNNLWHANPDSNKTIGQKISASKMGKSPNWVNPAERGRRISEGKKAAFEKTLAETGSKLSPEHRRKAGLARLGKKHTDEWKTTNSERMKAQWADGTRKPHGPRDPSKLKPRKVTLCRICGTNTLNPRKNFCSKEHRYQAMNVTRASLPNSKWFTPA